MTETTKINGLIDEALNAPTAARRDAAITQLQKLAEKYYRALSSEKVWRAQETTEVAHSVVIKLLGAGRSSAGPISEAFIRRLVNNSIVDRVRHRRVRIDLGELGTVGPDSAAGEVQVSGGGPTASERLQHEELREKITVALGETDSSWFLRCHDLRDAGACWGDVATELGAPSGGAARVRYTRLRSTLNEKLSANGSD